MIKKIRKEKGDFETYRTNLDRIVLRHATLPGFSLLETSQGGGVSFLFLEPVLELKIHNDIGSAISPSGIVRTTKSPEELIRGFLDPIFNAQVSTNDIPAACGFISYEFNSALERIPTPPRDEIGIPTLHIWLYRKIVRMEESVSLYAVEYEEYQHPFWSELDAESSIPIQSKPKRILDDGIRSFAEQHSNFTEERYRESVESIRESIRSGSVYQVNLSRQFVVSKHFDPAHLYLHLRASDPAEYGAIFTGQKEDGKPYSVVSASPELFFRTAENTISCSPIKGTRPRSTDAASDAANIQELVSSEKDRAELSMIVDLVRNDLGRIAVPCSVYVSAHARLRSHAHVHHLVSDVRAELPPNISLYDIIRALFPCGSVTGAPKIAAMEHIVQLEGSARGVYTGALGCVGPGGFSVFSVPIRTLVCDDMQVVFNSGGGVVIDSDGGWEAEETIHKSRGIVSALASLDDTITLQNFP